MGSASARKHEKPQFRPDVTDKVFDLAARCPLPRTSVTLHLVPRAMGRFRVRSGR